MKLNLQATTKEEQKVKAYLEANASEVLAEKINGGVRIQKDGKMLINKKTLAGFMKFACDEAKKQAEKGASSACIDDDTVYGWAVHYFEEDSIEGTLYNEDGTEYKAPMPKVTAKAPAVKSVPPKPQPKPQMSMFDLMGEDLEGKPEEEKPEDDEDTMPSDEEIQEIMAEIAEEEKTKPSKRTASPMYRKYLDVQEKYPQAVIAMRLGDFYEVFGKNAEGRLLRGIRQERGNACRRITSHPYWAGLRAGKPRTDDRFSVSHCGDVFRQNLEQRAYSRRHGKRR